MIRDGVWYKDSSEPSGIAVDKQLGLSKSFFPLNGYIKRMNSCDNSASSDPPKVDNQ